MRANILMLAVIAALVAFVVYDQRGPQDDAPATSAPESETVAAVSGATGDASVVDEPTAPLEEIPAAGGVRLSPVDASLRPDMPPDLGAPFRDGEADADAAAPPAPPDDDGAPPAESSDLSPHVLAVVSDLAARKAGLGYDMGSFFTEHLPYGSDTIRANNEPLTMCVAAVTEIMVRAINRWAEQTGSTVPYDILPARRWSNGARHDLRPWLFVHLLDQPIPAFGRPHGNGTQDALVLFGMGRSVPLSEALPGDFVNFNRASGSGHAAVFLSFLNRANEEVLEFGDDIVGFTYFSAQGSGVAGLGYRDAYFGDYCPRAREGRRRDCGVIRADNRRLLSFARLHSPDEWSPGDAAIFIDQLFNGATIESIEAQRYSSTRSLAVTGRALELERAHPDEIPQTFAINFDGVTTD